MFSAKRPAGAVSQVQESTDSEPSSVATSLMVPAPLTSSLPASLDDRVTTSGLRNPLGGTTTGRVPIVIKGELKRPEPLPPKSPEARRRHRKRLWVLGMLVLFVTIAATLLLSTPQGQELGAKFISNPQPNTGNLITKPQQKNIAEVAALATTTYMYQNDGYDPFSHGQVTVYDGTSSLPWPVGQCTYWANYRYHELTGYWVQWTGNADQWFQGAQEAGWDYAQTPPPGIPSIIVLMPYVQDAGWLGHVAVVESQTGNVVHTSNMNWGYGGSTHVEDVDFTLGAGVYFVWHKPAN